MSRGFVHDEVKMITCKSEHELVLELTSRIIFIAF